MNEYVSKHKYDSENRTHNYDANALTLSGATGKLP